jgi:hypothetical protein
MWVATYKVKASSGRTSASSVEPLSSSSNLKLWSLLIADAGAARELPNVHNLVYRAIRRGAVSVPNEL